MPLLSPPPGVSWEPLRPCSRDDRIWQPAPVSRLWYNTGGRLPANHSSVPHCSILCDVSLHSSERGWRSPWQLDRCCAGDITVLFLWPTHSTYTYYILLFVMFTIHFSPGEDQRTKEASVFHALLGWLGALYSWLLPVLPTVHEWITCWSTEIPQLPMGMW